MASESGIPPSSSSRRPGVILNLLPPFPSPSPSEFTLLFFARPSSSLHCGRFLSDHLRPFVLRANGSSAGKLRGDVASCVFVGEVPAPAARRRARVRNRAGAAFDPEEFAGAVGPSHENYAALHELLGIAAVPAVIVVRNGDGRVATREGRAAVEGCGEEEGEVERVLECWRRGEDGVVWYRKGCSVS